ncbi:MAG: M48 family metalloprotease [Acidimicrobiales bacterium]|nr:M48 family metalloprotease [Acidimicrobiales bacterium]
MTLLLLSFGLVAVALPAMRSRAIGADPRWFARLSTVALSLGLVCVMAALATSATIGALHAVTRVADDPATHLAPEGIVGACVSAILLTLMLIRGATIALRARRVRRDARAEGWLGEHRNDGSHDLVVLPTERLFAYSVDGRDPQIVVSQGLRRMLDDDFYGFVIDHERAHLRAGHRRSLLIATVVEGLLPFFPFASQSSMALRVAVERAADEDAAGEEPARRRRLANDMVRVSSRARVACGSELTVFRAENLTACPRSSRGGVAVALAGLVTLFAGALAVLAHATGDVSPYLALL